jgi:RNA polymerase sigma-70 factor (ECF subfamily)
VACRGDTKSATHGALSGSQQTLLSQVAAGDPAAVRECISEYGPLVWSIARRFAPSAGDAEDAVQEIFLELWKHAGRYDPALGSEAAFVTVVARRRMIERLRKAERRPQLRPAPDSFTDLDGSIAERCPEVTIAAGVLATLDPRQRRVLSLAVGQGMTYAELAEATTMPLEQVKSLVRRALVAVRKRLLTRGGER